MIPSPIINKKTVKGNSALKQAQKQNRRINGKGDGKLLKNYIGKVVSLTSSELNTEETRIKHFAADISKEDLLNALENADIRGMSGNGFPINEKIKTLLSSASSKKILLINAVECDPALLHDEWLLENRYDEIASGIRYIKQALSLDNAVLAAKKTNVRSDDTFSVSVVPPRYPMGEERFLIRQVLGISLENDEIPAKHGILVLNLQSVYQICKLVNKCYDGGRFITIADLTDASARVAYVYPTDNVLKLLDAHFSGKSVKAFSGHGVMACAEADETSDFSSHETFAAYSNPPLTDDGNKCRKCGGCNKKCPVKIKASKIVKAVDNNKVTDYSKLNIEHCIKCGSCTYFCPASKNVSGYVVRLKDNAFST